MPLTVTDVCNRALARLGQAQITDFDGLTVVPTLCRQHFESVRLQLLREHPWNFAIEREPLGLSVNQPRFGPHYQFALPPNYISSVEAFTDIEGRCQIDRFRIEGGFFVTSQEAVFLVFIADRPDPGTWDYVFTEAVSVLLASRMSVQLTGQPGTALLTELQNLILPKAMLYSARDDESAENNPVEDFINRASINQQHRSF